MASTTTKPVGSQQTFTDYLASVGVNDDIVIGSIVLYTISNAKVTYDNLVAWFDELGLDPQFLPNPIKPVDAFRAATGRVKFSYDLADGNSVELLIREVDSSAEMVTRHIMRELRDPKNKRLSYERVGEAIFYRSSRNNTGGHKVRFTVDGARLLNGEREKVETFVQGVEARYHELAQYLQSQALRAVLREYITYLNALPVKSGVYFVAKSRRDVLDSLQELVSRFDSGGDSMVHQVPLVGTQDQREMLTGALGDEVSRRCEALMQSLGDLNAKYAAGKIPAEQFGRASGEFQDIVEKAEEHVRVLGLGRDTADAALDIARESLLSMMERVEL